MRPTSDSHERLGARHVEVRKVLGRTVETPAEVVEYEPDRRWAVRRASGRVRPQVTYTLEPLPTGTHLTSTLSVPGARGAAAGLRPLVGALAPVARKDLERIRERLQRDGPAPGPGPVGAKQAQGRADGPGEARARQGEARERTPSGSDRPGGSTDGESRA